MPDTPNQRKRHNWVLMRKYYVSHPALSLADVAKKYKVSNKLVEDHSRKENWVGMRKQAVTKSEIKLVDNTSDVLAETNSKHANLYRMAQSHLTRRLQLEMALSKNRENASTKTITLGNATLPVIEDFKGLMGGKALKELMEAIKTAVDGERVALGLPTSVTKSSNDININNPYAEYSDDQLQRIIEITDAELRASNAAEADTTA